MSKRKVSIVDELRRAIAKAEKAGVTRYKLSMVSGVEQAVLSKLVHNQRVPTVATIERILAALGKRLAIVDR